MIQKFCNNLAGVNVNEKIGFIDTTGKMVVEPIYDDILTLRNGMVIVQLDGKWGFIDENGKMIDPIYDDVTDISFSLFAKQWNWQHC